MIWRKLCFLILSFSLSTTFAQTHIQQECDTWDCAEFPSGERPKEEPVLSKLSTSSGSVSQKKADMLIARNLKGVLFAGGLWINQGANQSVLINEGFGDYFSVTHNNNVGAGIVGAGAYIDSLELETDFFTVQYTATSFFIPQTTITGFVTQEGLVTNLAYGYDIAYLPSFIGLKITDKPIDRAYHGTFDVGVGFDVIFTNNFGETSLTPYTVTDNFFSGRHRSYSFDATLGVGLKVQTGLVPIEIGYRFFYLGQGTLPSSNTLVLNPLLTGHNFANAVICTVGYD